MNIVNYLFILGNSKYLKKLIGQSLDNKYSQLYN